MVDSPFSIPDFIHELSDIPLSDQLVCLHPEKGNLIQVDQLPTEKTAFEQKGTVRDILRIAQTFRKEADVNSLCAVRGTVSWIVDGNELLTPLFLLPLDWSVNRQNQELLLQTSELFELNPYVKRVLRLWTDEVTNWDELSLEESLEHIRLLQEKQQLSMTVSEQYFIGNFHYHRYHMLRELEGIERSEEHSPLIDELLGSTTTNAVPLNFSTDLLTPADVDQLGVFEAFRTQNVVVQGPPGTGKSQVLTNLLGKLMNSNLRTLVVSEKKVALEVLVKKLEELNLSRFAFIVHSQTKSKDLVQQLRENWLFLENYTPTDTRSLKLSDQRIAQLQLLLDRLNSPTLVGGISYHDFKELESETPIANTVFQSDVPAINEWLEYKESVRVMEDKLGNLSVLRLFRPAFFGLQHGDRLLDELVVLWEKVKSVCSSGTWQELNRLYETLGRCQLIENEWYKPYSQLLNKPKEWKKFERNWLRSSELEKKLSLAIHERQNWKTPPTNTQLDSWEMATGFWKRRSRERALRALLMDKTVNLNLAIENWRRYLALQEEKDQLEAYFRELGLPISGTQLAVSIQFAKTIERDDSSVLAEVASWSSDKRKQLLKVKQPLEELVHQMNRYFDPKNEDLIGEMLSEKQQKTEKLLPVWKELRQWPAFLFRLCSDSSDWKEMQSKVLLSNWRKTEALFPELAKFDGNVLKERMLQSIEEQDKELNLFAQALLNLQKQKFTANESLLLKPSQKCTPVEKELRAKLKRGKAILVREFAKSRTHTSIRELLDSDAGTWIQDLIPVWLATPTQVADHFPLKTNLFHAVVFDEASQIPLPNALGAMFRSERALVAGDEQQMSPTSYFGKSWTGHDLLHQAAFYFKRVALKHHYRSTHPELISFSNKHFYGNELLVYPSSDQKQVVFRHRCEGRFIDRKNSIEATAVARFLEQLDWNQSIGIVAFSEEQLKTIWQSCSSKVQENITNGQDDNTVFFKTLEQVQGDEADCMVISTGYAPNEDNEFHLRFGPLNQANGYKRLNVLLTRAIREMHFFTSMDAATFGISANESVNLLRKFLIDLEQEKDASQVMFPHDLRPAEQKQNQLSFPGIAATLNKAEELLTFHRVMTQRGWKLDYTDKLQ